MSFVSFAILFYFFGPSTGQLNPFGPSAAIGPAQIGQPCNPSFPQSCADPTTGCVNGICQCRRDMMQAGFTCVPISRRAMLDEPCNQDTDCAAATAWSYCKDRKCQCRPQYNRNGHACKPSKYTCPVGQFFNDPMKVNGNPVECILYSAFSPFPQPSPFPQTNPIGKRKKRQARPLQVPLASPVQPVNAAFPPQLNVAPFQPGSVPFPQPGVAPFPQSSWIPLAQGCPKYQMDNCPVGTYCNPIQPDDTVPLGGVKKGICCFKPKPTCPTGDPLSTSPYEDCSGCPHDTHFCFCDELTNVAACCPRPCPPGNIFINNQCLPPGGTATGVTPICNSDQDCSGGAKCVAADWQSDKMCLCPGGLSYINGICTASLCATGQPLVIAGTGQIETCSATIPCPANYQCDPTHSVCCPGQGSSSSYCPPGETFAGASCSVTNPACPPGAVCINSACCYPQIPTSTGTCPPGQQFTGTCTPANPNACPQGSTCNPQTNACCMQSAATPANLCPQGQQPIGTCSAANLACPQGATCSPQTNVCCLQQQGIATSPTTNVCPPGQQFAGASCGQNNPSCPTGSTCSLQTNTCCFPQGASPTVVNNFCPPGQQYAGVPCGPTGACPVGFSCNPQTSGCCSSQTATANACPPGQQMVGQCTAANPSCPQASTCSPQANVCCSVTGK